MKVPFFSLKASNDLIRDSIQKSFSDFFESNNYILGENVRSFEERFAAFNGVKYCIGTSNGLDALVNCLKVLNIGKGDEVIVPSNSFFATSLAVRLAGAEVVFADPDERTYNLDPKKVNEAITTRTKAIIPVHLYGQACCMSELMKIASSNKLHIIEDNAQAHGASYDGKKTGSFGIINATSFYPTKNLGALGDAGAITTDNKQLAEAAYSYRNYGSSKKYYHDILGENNRLDECQAGFLSVKLNYLERWNSERIRIAELYDSMFSANGKILIPILAPKCNSVYHLYVIQTEKRDELMEYLKSKEISTLIHYPVPAHLQEAMQDLGIKKGQFPIAEKLAKRTLSLPIYPGLSEKQIEYVGEQINLFFR